MGSWGRCHDSCSRRVHHHGHAVRGPGEYLQPDISTGQFNNFSSNILYVNYYNFYNHNNIYNNIYYYYHYYHYNSHNYYYNNNNNNNNNHYNTNYHNNNNTSHHNNNSRYHNQKMWRTYWIWISLLIM